MITTLVLALLEIHKEFVIEKDALGEGIRAILMPKGHLTAFISKALSPKHQLLSIYKKEMLGILFTLKK